MIQLQFNSIQFQKQLEIESQKVNELNNALELIKTITEGEIQTLDVNALNDFLNKKTGFRNAELSAKAYGYEAEHKTIEAASTINSEWINFDEKYFVEAEKLKEFHTNYLSENEAKIYDVLTKVSKVMNGTDYRYYQCIKQNGEIDKMGIRAINNLYFR